MRVNYFQGLLAFAALSAGAWSFSPPEDGLAFEGLGRDCIALAVFTEARGEPLMGQFAVAEVIRNRIQDDGWQSDPCDVVTQNQQFHGVRDWPKGLHPRAVDAQAWETALLVTDAVMVGEQAACGIAVDHFFRTDTGTPSWASQMKTVCVVGDHTFLSSVAP